MAAPGAQEPLSRLTLSYCAAAAARLRTAYGQLRCACTTHDVCVRYVLLPHWSTTKICHVWLPTSRKTACWVRLRSNSIARPVSSCFRLTYCYRSTVKWLYGPGDSIHTQKADARNIFQSPKCRKAKAPWTCLHGGGPRVDNVTAVSHAVFVLVSRSLRH